MNPKKRIFTVSQGNFLGNSISKSGIKVDLDRVWNITQIPHLVNNKSMWSFLGKINFLRNFNSGYAQIVKLIQDMIKHVVYSLENKEKEVLLPYQ